jgi:hypothetical protein
VTPSRGTALAAARRWASNPLTRSLFVRFLKPGGILAVHNSCDRQYAEGHDGYRRLVVEALREPNYADVYCVESTSFGRRTGRSSNPRA